MKIIKIDGVIGWENDAKDIREQLPKDGIEDVTVEIASPGGLISEGFKIFNELNNYKGNVDTHLTGPVASMGTYIAMVGKKRTAEKNATFMIHNGSMGAWGDHRLMFKAGKHLDSLTNIIAKELSVKSDTPLPDIRNAMDETTYYYGDEIKEAGFVHEMVGDADPEDRAEAIATAELMFNECQEKINSPDVVKKEMKALATMMDESKNKQPKAGKPENNKQEVNKMTLEELKEKNPELYARVIAIGVKEGEASGTEKERARVKGLTEMRAKFKKEHSQNVIDQAIVEGHDMSQVSVNLMAADQAAEELEKATTDNPAPPANGDDDVPEMVDGKMTHQDHIDAVSAETAKTIGLKK